MIMTETGAMQQTVQNITTELKNKPGALLPILHAVQNAFGYIPKECIPDIAKALNVTRAEVHGVISFYHYFRDTPPGNHTIHLCRAESCLSMGSKSLHKHIIARLGIDFHQTTTNGQFTLEPVYCLGNCAASPAIQIDKELYGNITPEAFDEIIIELGASK
jgi:formate dehydrogenase subunit gamma